MTEVLSSAIAPYHRESLRHASMTLLTTATLGGIPSEFETGLGQKYWRRSEQDGDARTEDYVSNKLIRGVLVRCPGLTR